MAVIKVYVSDREKQVIQNYASMDERSDSEMLRKAMREKVKRDKKTDDDGNFNRMAQERRLTGCADVRKRENQFRGDFIYV